MTIPLTFVVGAILLAPPAGGRESPQWKHLSTKTGDLPAPGTSKEQTGCLILDIDKNGLNDIVVTSRLAGGAVVWYRREKLGWTIYPIDRGLNIEAGGASADIDGDGDRDLVFGDDYTGSKLYWWENPYPHYSPTKLWVRREIKCDGGTTHHDQIFGDFAGDGIDRLAFWVQRSKVLYLASPPRDPRQASRWPAVAIARVGAGEGLARADIDGDGTIDLIGGGYWFKHQGGMQFQSNLIDNRSLSARAAAGQIVEGAGPEVVFVVGDGVGRLKWFERRGENWVDHDLLGEDVDHGHSLELADIDEDGHLDIFCAEMAQWTDTGKLDGNPGPRMWVFYGDGRGRFTKTLLATGIDNHESRVSDLDGDGDLDIVSKPYTRDAPGLDIWLNEGTRRRRTSPISD
jgi:FG-GAP-like repeat